MKLYFSPGSCSLSALISLYEVGLDFEPVAVLLDAHTFSDGRDFYAVNSLGYVPVLEASDGTRLREVAAILQYIADQSASKSNAAGQSFAHYRQQEWLAFIGSEIHAAYVPLFGEFPEAVKASFKQKLLARYGWIDAQLQGQDFLQEGAFGVADAYLFAVSNWADYVGLDLSSFENVARWRAAVSARPAVQQALQLDQA